MIFTDQPESPCRDKLSMAFTQKMPNRRVYDFCRCQMQFDESWSTLTPHSHTKTLIPDPPPPHCLVQQLSGSPCCRGQGWVLGLNQSCHGCQACLCLLLITCRPPQVLSASLVLSLSRGSRRADNHVAEPAQKLVFCNPSKKKKKCTFALVILIPAEHPSIKDGRSTRLPKRRNLQNWETGG